MFSGFFIIGVSRIPISKEGKLCNGDVDTEIKSAAKNKSRKLFQDGTLVTFIEQSASK